ncbi:hypothetical protein PMAYCL1PPCAC_19617, partial [Pristionchus mayeri]
ARAAKSKQNKSALVQYQYQWKNEYSASAKRLLSLNPAKDRDVEIVSIHKKFSGIVGYFVRCEIIAGISDPIASGEYIDDLYGGVYLQKEFSKKDLIAFAPNDQTFLFELEGNKFIIDAREHRNGKYVRRSCKPNAELYVIKSGTDLHVYIKATKSISTDDEITIAFDDDWKTLPDPARRCACKRGAECELERYFSNMKENRGSSSGGRPTATTAAVLKEKKKLSSGTGKRKSEEAKNEGGSDVSASTPLQPQPTKRSTVEVMKDKKSNSTSSLPSVPSTPREYIRSFTDEEAWERYQKV